MLNTGEVIRDSVNDFSRVQRHMKLAKKENATETYESLKEDYLNLKAILTSLGVNLTDIDQIKE